MEGRSSGLCGLIISRYQTFNEVGVCFIYIIRFVEELVEKKHLLLFKRTPILIVNPFVKTFSYNINKKTKKPI